MRPQIVLAVLLVSLPAGAVTNDWVYVGNPGNAADRGEYCDGDSCGSVPYGYYISKYEVTNSQYAEFLNAKAAADPLELYYDLMGSTDVGGITRSGVSGSYAYAVKPGFENKPVVFVSFYDALRFANWLNNGQGSGDTETGAYTLLGGRPTPTNGLTVTRNTGPTVTTFLPSENEWYKAAYYSPSGIYLHYPTGTNVQPGCVAPDSDTGNSANCKGWVDPVSPTDVGAYGLSASPYGTFDQGGNAREWNEQIWNGRERSVRGGSLGFEAVYLASSLKLTLIPQGQLGDVGFRVGSLVASLVPECGDGLENDGDGLTDLADPGCADPFDLDEHAPTLPCDDGVDNDGDGWADYLAAGGGDPACASPTSPRERTECQDGVNNDYSPGIDFDGGASLNGGVPMSTPDRQCVGKPWRNSEAISQTCGLGFELVFLAPLLAGLTRRRRA